MTVTSKPVDKAFILDESKSDLFFNKKVNKSSDVLKRFESRKTKTTVMPKKR